MAAKCCCSCDSEMGHGGIMMVFFLSDGLKALHLERMGRIIRVKIRYIIFKSTKIQRFQKWMIGIEALNLLGLGNHRKKQSYRF